MFFFNRRLENKKENQLTIKVTSTIDQVFSVRTCVKKVSTFVSPNLENTTISIGGLQSTSRNTIMRHWKAPLWMEHFGMRIIRTDGNKDAARVAAWTLLREKFDGIRFAALSRTACIYYRD